MAIDALGAMSILPIPPWIPPDARCDPGERKEFRQYAGDSVENCEPGKTIGVSYSFERKVIFHIPGGIVRVDFGSTVTISANVEECEAVRPYYDADCICRVDWWNSGLLNRRTYWDCSPGSRGLEWWEVTPVFWTGS